MLLDKCSDLLVCSSKRLVPTRNVCGYPADSFKLYDQVFFSRFYITAETFTGPKIIERFDVDVAIIDGPLSQL